MSLWITCLINLIMTDVILMCFVTLFFLFAFYCIACISAYLFFAKCFLCVFYGICFWECYICWSDMYWNEFILISFRMCISIVIFVWIDCMSQLSCIFSVKNILLHIPILFLFFLIDKSVCLCNTRCELLLIKMYIPAIYMYQIAHDRFKFVLKKSL